MDTDELAIGCGFQLIQIDPAANDELLTQQGRIYLEKYFNIVPQYASGETTQIVTNSTHPNPEAFYSTSNAHGNFHTDGSLLEEIPNYVSLLCLTPAKSGGHTVLVDMKKPIFDSSSPLYKYVEILERDYPFLSASKNGYSSRRPILKRNSKNITFSYIRNYIENGIRKNGGGDFTDAFYAFSEIDRYSSLSGNQQRFRLKRGQILAWDNHRFLHGRTIFEDSCRPRTLARFYCELKE